MQKNINIDNVNIVPMTISHLDSVVAIERSVFLNPWTYDMYKAEVLKDYSYHYVLLYGDEVIGFFGYFSTGDGAGEVTNIAIKKEYHRLGLGNKVVNYLQKDAISRGMDKIFLETRDGNAPARALYEKHGFTLVNKRKKYYDGVEDACIYMWERA